MSEFSPSQLREARRFAVQFLYQLDVLQQPFLQQQNFDRFCEQVELPDELRDYVRDVVKQTIDSAQNIDPLIEKHAHNWKLSRISKVDLAILRVCTAELRRRNDVNFQVIVADAAEIGKEFGAENSSGFVNGVLDAIVRDVRKSPLENTKKES